MASVGLPSEDTGLMGWGPGEAELFSGVSCGVTLRLQMLLGLLQSLILLWECWVSRLMGSKFVVGGDHEGIRKQDLALLPLLSCG